MLPLENIRHRIYSVHLSRRSWNIHEICFSLIRLWRYDKAFADSSDHFLRVCWDYASSTFEDCWVPWVFRVFLIGASLIPVALCDVSLVVWSSFQLVQIMLQIFRLRPDLFNDWRAVFIKFHRSVLSILLLIMRVKWRFISFTGTQVRIIQHWVSLEVWLRALPLILQLSLGWGQFFGRKKLIRINPFKKAFLTLLPHPRIVSFEPDLSRYLPLVRNSLHWGLSPGQFRPIIILQELLSFRSSSHAKTFIHLWNIV